MRYPPAIMHQQLVAMLPRLFAFLFTRYILVKRQKAKALPYLNQIHCIFTNSHLWHPHDIGSSCLVHYQNYIIQTFDNDYDVTFKYNITNIVMEIHHYKPNSFSLCSKDSRSRLSTSKRGLW